MLRFVLLLKSCGHLLDNGYKSPGFEMGKIIIKLSLPFTMEDFLTIFVIQFACCASKGLSLVRN